MFVNLLLLSIATAFVQGAAIPDAKSPTDFGGAGVFAFGDYVVDTNRMRDHWIPGYSQPLVDCSNAQYYCLRPFRPHHKVQFISFVVPKRCVAPKVGDIWAVSGNETKVVAIRDDLDPHHKMSTSRTYYLSTKGSEHAVLSYAPRAGVFAITYANKGSDLVAALEAGATRPGEAGRGRGLRLNSFDLLARCS